MRPLRETQAAFRAAILADDLPAFLHRLRGPVPPQVGLRIYANNVHASLTEALAATYPVVRRLVGEGFFRYAAHSFIRSQPPRRPALLAFGAAFPDFLAGFGPAASLPYLPDVARLELAWHEAYHAEEATALSASDLQALPTEQLPALRLALHPSARLLASPHPVDAIWEANQPDCDPEATVVLPPRGAQLLVIRPGAEVEIRTLSAPLYSFLSDLQRGLSLGAAAETAGEAFDLAAAMRDLVLGATFTHWS
jgi:hypothetical protein